tara:strand:+ start:59 stop:532 length:474 start_codon:yes stop_codon:yes gene_type:complete
MKNDMEMFEGFFDNFPIPVTMWIIFKDGTVVSQRGNGIVCTEANSIEDLFECPILKNMSIAAHERALMGEPTQYLARNENQIYYVSLVPRKNDDIVTHVSGIAWDITSNAIMLAAIEKIVEITTGRRGAYKEINSLANRAVLASRLKEFVENENIDG